MRRGSRPSLAHAPVAVATMLALLVVTRVSAAQPTDDSPAFSLASSHVYSTRERPAVSLTFRAVTHLDFRTYRVRDPFAFFSNLRDAHQLGSEQPLVPQERTWLERIAFWKAARRGDIRQFARAQFSPAYRVERRRRQDTTTVVQRRTVNVRTFAQVPVLNAAQLVHAWRELLPPVREPEYRRVPLDLTTPGLYVVEAVNGPQRAYTVVIVSDLGVVTKAAPGQLLVFAADRFSGIPQRGCRVLVLADREPVAAGETSDDGTFSAPVSVTEPDAFVTVAQCGDQAVATDPGSYAVRQPTRELLGYIYTDRPVYRPGHTVRYKAVLRWRDRSAVTAFGSAPVEVTVVDDGQKVLSRASLTPDEFGTVNGSLVLPATAALGYYRVVVTSGDDRASGSFEVQEYRKPEYDVSVAPELRRTLQGTAVTVRVAARYYFGQPVARARVQYVVHRQSYYSPLRIEGAEDTGDATAWYGGDETLQGSTTLDDTGQAAISVPLETDRQGQDYTARIEARVVDEAGREVAGSGTVIATVGRFLVTIRTTRYLFAPGASAPVTVRAMDYDGAVRAGVPINVAVERIEYRSGGDPIVSVLHSTAAQTDADGRAAATVPLPRERGSYRIRAYADDDGRSVGDSTYVYVPGPGDTDGGGGDESSLELILDRKTYTPGDSARVLLRGANINGPVLVTKESHHISWHRVIRVTPNEPFDVPVAPEDVGDTYVTLVALTDDRLLRAERRLSVPATAHQLTVTATPSKTVFRPGEPGLFTLSVADAAGAPVRAQLSVALVDEALYGVRPDITPDPLRFFYRREYNTVSTQFSRDYSFVGYSGTESLLLTGRRRRPLTLADFKSERPDRPRVRKDFPDTVFWTADITTDAQGQASISVDYPDSLTTWRLTVRAITPATDVGGTRVRTLTTKDLILRVIAPRFLTEGDRVTVPTIVHNYLPDAKKVSVSLVADGLAAADAATRTLGVAPGGETRSDWAFVAERPRSVVLKGKAISDVAGDAVELSLPVLPLGLQRTVGSAGSLVGNDRERQLDLSVPTTANASAQTVRVSVSPSLAGTLLAGLDYLTSFPWGCTEQTLSSFVPNLTVLRTLTELRIVPTERLGSLDRQIADGLRRLYANQHTDGGWGWWKTDANHPFMTAYALDGLLQAQERQVRIESWRVDAARQALERLYAEYPRALPDLKAYELLVLARAAATSSGDATGQPAGPFDLAAALDELWSRRSQLSASGQALLLLTLDLRRDTRATELASSLVSLARTEGDVSWWPVDYDPLLNDVADTTSEATALAVEALAGRDPQNPVLERAARWLVVNRSPGGYWVSTKQTAFALRGLLAFMQARGERAQPVEADVVVNGTVAATHRFDAASLSAVAPASIEVPARSGRNTVQVVRRGPGSVYFDAAVRYYDKPAASEPTGSRRLAVSRTYAVLSPVALNGRIVYREGTFTGEVHTGDLILVRLTVAGSSDWRYLSIEDPIPAGTEPVERDDLYELERRPTWSWGSQRELRDDRAVFFQESIPSGRAEFSYLLKVATPGTFTAMPTRVSPMYVPDVAASSSVTTVTVTPDEIR